MDDIVIKLNSVTTLNGKLDVLKKLFMTDNGDIKNADYNLIVEISDNFKEYQTTENIDVFDEFFTNNFYYKYKNIIDSLKNKVIYNMCLNALNKANSINNIEDIKKDIKAITNSNLYKNYGEFFNYDLSKIFNILNLEERISTIDNNNISLDTLKYIIIDSSESEKEVLINKYSSLLGSSKLYDVIKTVQNEDIRKQIIINNISLFDDYYLKQIISSFNNYNNVIDILKKCDDKILNYLIEYISNNIDDNIKYDLLELFLDRLDGNSLSKIISSINDDNKKYDLLEIYLDRLDGYGLSKIISSIRNDRKLFELFEKYISKFDGKNIKYIFDNLYDRFIKYNDYDKKNEISDIIEIFVDKYFNKFNSFDIPKVLNIFDYEGKIEIIDKYINKIDFYWPKIIADCNTVDEKLKIFNKYSKYISKESYILIIKSIELFDDKIKFINNILDILQSDDICNIILDFDNIDDVNKLINLYQDKLTEYDIVEIVCKKYSDTDKLSYLDNNISQENKCKIVSSIKDDSLKFTYIKNNEQIINGYGLALILNSLTDDNDKIKYLNLYEKLFDNNDLTIIILSIEDFSKKLNLIEKYNDKLDIIKIAFSCSLKDSLFLMKKYSVYFDIIHLTYYLLSKYDKNEFIIEFFDILPSQLISTYLSSMFSTFYLTDDLKLDLIKKYFNQFGYIDIAIIFNSLESLEKNNLLSDYIDTMDSKKICLALSTFDNINDILEIIKKYSGKIIKEDIIYIVLGKTKKMVSNSENINNEGLIQIYSLIFDGKIDNNKCNNIINNLLSLDIYSINAIENYLLNSEFQDFNNFDSFVNIIVKLSKSNSTEIQHLTPNLVNLLMGKEKDLQDKIINELENVFLRNNLPMMAKLYKVFDIMHPNFGEFNDFDYQSPNLKSKNNSLYKQIILFADLMRITVGSNNRSLKEYIKHIEVGNSIAKELIYSDIDIELLDDNYKEILINYLNHLETLYNNTLYGKNNPVKLSRNIKKDILMFISLFGKNEKDFDINKLPDRIVKMFAHFAGIDTIDELKTLMDTTIKSTDERNRERARLSFEIHKGYFVKGIANQDKEDEFYNFLTNIFQNGSLCKELLGDAARSDTTPMDTDVSRILEEPTSFEDAFTNPKYASSRYGPLWIVLKDNDRFNETNGTNNKYIPGKLEVFETSMDGAGHYGIRTGFASSDIDYLVVDESRIKMDRIKYEVVMNGFYIPLVNTKGNLVFTPDEYDELHEKMAGLSYYGTEGEYKFASELDSFDINNTGYDIDIVKSINVVAKVREEVINKLRETGLDIKLGRSLDLKDKCIDLIDTGSTGRGTNKMNGYDFDFVMRVDKDIYTDDDKMNELYQSFKNVFPDINIEGHKIRKYKVKLSNGREVELDITFIMKTNKMDYSTEECLQDRLRTIRNMDEIKYKKVLENIVLAKYILKSVYKSKNVAENPQGGLGGVGIENWILQNGGSFERAARDFLEKAEGKNFKEFTKIYTIWDFGQDNLSFTRSDGYTHDEFIKNNMTEEGYNKMVGVLKEYVNTLEHSKQL